jgi:threonine dehydratase
VHAGEKTVAEGAGAAGVAALLSNKVDVRGKKVATVICGGNIDVNAIAQVIECGLIDSGRRIKFSMFLPDRPGSLSQLMSQISSHQANV